MLEHRPGLDGLRGLAVGAVVAYHLGVPGTAGGWLGVSLFFTLSGFLITALLLGEHEVTGRIDLRAFWARRARRLLPAAMVALVLAGLVGALNGGPASLAGDLRAAVAYVANWRFVADGTGYADAFAQPSPVQHLWSLAIEEQFYVVFPVLALVALRGGRRRGLGVATAAVALASLAAQVLVAGTDRRYFGTDTRAAELALGALAAVVAWPRLRAGRAIPMGAPGALALVATLGLWGTASLRWAWWGGGGFTAIGALSAVLVVAAATTGLARPLAAAPLTWLGRRSYGVYLYHWPLLLALTPERVGLDGAALALVRIGATLAVAEVSHRVVEQPIRQRRALLAAWPALAAAVTMGAAVVVAAGLVPARLRQPAEARLAVALAAPLPVTLTRTSLPPSTAPTTVPPAPAPATVAVPPPPPIVWLVGDSVPYLLGVDLAGREAELGARVVNLALPSCDGARGFPRMRLALGDPFVEPETCSQWEATWPQALAASPPDEVLVMLGATTIVDRDLSDEWRDPCDPEFRAWYEPEVVARLDWLAGHTGARITLVTTPWADDGARFIAHDRHQRTQCINDTYRAVAAARPDLRMVDLAAWLCPEGPDRCRPLRADGLHYSSEHALEVTRFLLTGA